MGVARHVAAVLVGLAILLGGNGRQSAVAHGPVPPRESVGAIDARPGAVVALCVGDTGTVGWRPTGAQLDKGFAITCGPLVARRAAYKKPEQEGCLLSHILRPGATVELTFSGSRFVIPAPYVNGFTRAADDALIYMLCPSFGPLCGTKPAEGMGQAEMFGDLFIIIEDKYAQLPLEELLARKRGGIGARVPGGSAFGLDREVPDTGAKLSLMRDLYVGRENGTLNVFIDCNLGSLGLCDQFFLTVAGSLEVTYSPKLLPHWQEIQNGSCIYLNSGRGKYNDPTVDIG